MAKRVAAGPRFTARRFGSGAFRCVTSISPRVGGGCHFFASGVALLTEMAFGIQSGGEAS